MMPTQRIAIIGGGNMGEALVKGLAKTHELSIVEADKKRAAYLKKFYAVAIVDLSQALKHAQVVILAVKPQDMPALLGQIKKTDVDIDKVLFISIAAGLTTSFFEKTFNARVKVVRAMPNMPALIAQGITAYCAGKYAKSADLKLAGSLLSSMGKTIEIDQSMMDALTAVSGSGPAYVFLFVQAWLTAAKSLGFKDKQAKEFVYQTLIGSVQLLQQSPLNPGELKDKVTSKGGTTAAALEVLAKGRFEQNFSLALKAACKRAKELAK